MPLPLYIWKQNCQSLEKMHHFKTFLKIFNLNYDHILLMHCINEYKLIEFNSILCVIIQSEIDTTHTHI